MKSRSLKPAVLVLAAVLILALLAAIVITQTARSRAEQAITLLVRVYETAVWF